MTKYEKIAEWIISQDVGTGLKDSDIKEIAEMMFGEKLTKTGIKYVKEELLNRNYINFKDSKLKDSRPRKDVDSKAQAVLDYYEEGGNCSEHIENVLTYLFGNKYDDIEYTTEIAKEDLAKVYDVMKKDYQNQINKYPKSHEVPTSAFDYFGLIQRKLKDSPDWETLKRSKDFVLKRLFKELEEEKAKPMSVEQENNIADIKAQIRKRAKEIKNVPNDIYDKKVIDGKYNPYVLNISVDRKGLGIYNIVEDKRFKTYEEAENYFIDEMKIVYSTNPKRRITMENDYYSYIDGPIRLHLASISYNEGRNKDKEKLLKMYTDDGSERNYKELAVKDKKVRDGKLYWDLEYDRAVDESYIKKLYNKMVNLTYIDPKKTSYEEFKENAFDEITEDKKAHYGIKDSSSYALIKEDKYYDPEGLNIDENEKNILYVAGTKQECLIELEILHKEMKDKYSRDESVSVSPITDSQFYVYFRNAIAKDYYRVVEMHPNNVKDAKLTRKQKLWYGEELEKFIHPQYLRRNYQLKRIKRKGGK